MQVIQPKEESSPVSSTAESPRPAASTPAPTPTPAAAASQASSPPGPAIVNRGERRVKMSRLRLRVADRLKDAQNTCAFTTPKYLERTSICTWIY